MKKSSLHDGYANQVFQMLPAWWKQPCWMNNQWFVQTLRILCNEHNNLASFDKLIYQNISFFYEAKSVNNIGMLQQVRFDNSSSKLLLHILWRFNLHIDYETNTQVRNRTTGRYGANRLKQLELTAFNALNRTLITLSGFLDPIICKQTKLLDRWSNERSLHSGEIWLRRTFDLTLLNPAKYSTVSTVRLAADIPLLIGPGHKYIYGRRSCQQNSFLSSQKRKQENKNHNKGVHRVEPWFFRISCELHVQLYALHTARHSEDFENIFHMPVTQKR